jgi:hypothetical protein
MSKRLLVTEQEKKQILSMYLAKGILLEKRTNDEVVVKAMEKEINQIISEVQNELFESLQIKFKGMDKQQNLMFSILYDKKDTGEVFNLKKQSGPPQFISYYETIQVNFAPLRNYVQSIYDNPDYKSVLDRYPKIKTYIDEYIIQGLIIPNYGANDFVIFANQVRKTSGDIYKFKNIVNFGEKLTTTGPGSNIFSFKIKGGGYLEMQVDKAALELVQFYVPDPYLPDDEVDPEPIPDRNVVSIEIGLDITQPFEFNETDLTERGQSELDDLIDDYNREKIKYSESTYGSTWQEYVDYLKKNKIKVTTSSSIDEDPEQEINYVEGRNAVDGCGGLKKRRDYNFCLSEKRANVIISSLENSIPELSGAFIADPIGETDKFDPGKKWPIEKNNKNTVNNRRVVVVFPKFTKEYQD